MDNVISFGTDNKYTEPNKILISILEELLEYAKNGDITSVAYIGVMDSGSIMTGKYLSEGCNVFEVVGSVENLKYRILREYIE